MVDAKTRLLVPALAVIAGTALVGCEASKDGGAFPKPDLEPFTALFAPTAAVPSLPFPTDLFFAGSTDGTLNIPSAATPPVIFTRDALNTLDGFSTTAPITTSFSHMIGNASLHGSTVHVIEMYLSNTTKAPAQGDELPAGVTSPVRRKLAFGTDFKAEACTEFDCGGKILTITPLKPLTPSTGAVNTGYIVILTDGITNDAGVHAQPSETYEAFKSAPADCSTFSDATSIGLCRLTKAQLAIGQAVGVDPSSVVLSWSFSTQSIDDTFGVLAQIVPAQPIGVQATGLTTHDANAALQGKANLYVGTTQVPYYSAVPANANDASVLKSFWTAAGASPVPGLDPTSRWLTRFNPVPLTVANLTIPLLVTVPNATANLGAGCPKPDAGWPVAIVQHGITRDRTDALAMADSFADACFIVAAIDLPLHGITDETNPFYQADNERTFNLDLINNDTGASGPDGKIDPSGTHSISALLSSPLTGRDGLRQGEVDIGVLAKSLANLDVTGDAQPDIDASRVHYVGLSLGGIVGVAQAKYAPAIRTVTVGAPGGVQSRLLLDSPTFGATIRKSITANFAASSLNAPADGTIFNNFFREVQTLVDPGDPINHVSGTVKPLHLIEVYGDQVVPNSATDALIIGGDMTQLTTVGPNAVAAGAPVWVGFTAGDHSSLFSPAASLAATVEMQTEAVKFAASAVQPGGPFVVLTDATVIDTGD
jgi:dienelactone hydrolase